MYVMTDTTGRIGATSATHHLGEGEVEHEFPPEFDFTRQQDWRLVDGALVHDPLPNPQPVPTPTEVLRSQMDDVILAMADMIGGAL
ncbi:MAG: hypothetical protein VB099_21135 [Candidatus Limiplasma sp.]|nr:hypothetical protein [Candidatus Limiplasma sp.]